MARPGVEKQPLNAVDVDLQRTGWVETNGVESSQEKTKLIGEVSFISGGAGDGYGESPDAGRVTSPGQGRD